jgi:hypothetical protein
MSPNNKYRAEKWEISYDVETAFGEGPAGKTANRLLGVFQEASLPNPKFDFQFIWGFNPTKRNWYTVYQGKAQSTGSIGNIILLDGRSLYLPIANSITTTGPVSGVYTHTINETMSLPSFRLVATNIDDAETDKLSRWFVGGKINTGTYHCEEGNMLMMDINAIFKMPYFLDTDNTTTSLTPWYSTDAHKATITASDFCAEPYYFSQATIKGKWPIFGLGDTTFKTIKTWKLEVNNNLEPKYYLASSTAKVPYEIWEGRREYTMSLVVDLVDSDVTNGFTKDTPWLELLNQGGPQGTALTGAAFSITFDKSAAGDGSDSITFTTPADYTTGPSCAGNDQGSIIIGAPMNIGGTGIISVPMEIKCRTLRIVVKDGLTAAQYPLQV